MTLRFPQIFTLLMLATFAASIALPRGASGRVTDSLQFLFSPISAPVQWYVGDRAERAAADVAPPAILPAADPSAGEVKRLQDENVALLHLAENLRGQLDTLRAREAESERVGADLRDLVHSVAVLGVESGRDVLRLSGTNVPVDVGAAVTTEAGIVGRVLSVGAANQSSVRLITDRGFKLVGTFVRTRATSDGSIAIDAIKEIPPTLVEGMGGGAMRIDSLKNDLVANAGLRVGDVVVLAADATQPWPIELHGRRIGIVTAVGESVTTPGIAEIRVRPEQDLLRLKSCWLILPPQMMPAR